MNEWIPERRPLFYRQFGRLDSETRKRIEGAITELLAAENPARLGKYKPSMRIFAYDVGRKYRIVYNVN